MTLAVCFNCQHKWDVKDRYCKVFAERPEDVLSCEHYKNTKYIVYGTDAFLSASATQHLGYLYLPKTIFILPAKSK